MGLVFFHFLQAYYTARHCNDVRVSLYKGSNFEILIIFGNVYPLTAFILNLLISFSKSKIFIGKLHLVVTKESRDGGFCMFQKFRHFGPCLVLLKQIISSFLPLQASFLGFFSFSSNWELIKTRMSFIQAKSKRDFVLREPFKELEIQLERE